MANGDAGDIRPDVFVGQDFYVPAYGVVVRGRPLAEQLRDVTSVSYSDSLTAIDSFSLTVNNWDAEALRFKYSDDDTFAPWQDVEVWMGYYHDGRDERRRMLTGDITTLAPNFPASGGPTLTVGGLNLFHRFRTAQVTRTFFNKKDTDIARALVDEIDQELRKVTPGLSVRLDEGDARANLADEQEIKFLIVNNQYPIVFLMERARRLGYDLSMEEIPHGRQSREVIFHYRRSNAVKRNTYALKWGASLIGFQPALRTADQVAKVTVRGWSPGAKKPIEKTATRATIAGEGVLDPAKIGVNEPALCQEMTVDLPVGSEAEADQLSREILRQRACELITAKGKTVGLPDLRAGAKVLIDMGRDRAPWRFSGVYLVTDTTHSIGEGGYTTDFTARKEGGPPQ
jgi:phage protein D